MNGWHVDPAELRKQGRLVMDIATEMAEPIAALGSGPAGFSASVALDRRTKQWLADHTALTPSVGDAGQALVASADNYEASDRFSR
ncbi:hypothetical protein Rhe02_80800 [Rhizocola hellebori]|uniref:Uncharacterized protein n=1 Tax=Rhizocola hellebori TaxID=1392758 RepID=A0A8J3QIH0_9ACTN|nr:hypothetical protein [Rhizocola hellebori]GIH10013.1 hypothetical protein Rhe02_80800 [Rhizocola hellebori]